MLKSVAEPVRFGPAPGFFFAGSGLKLKVIVFKEPLINVGTNEENGHWEFLLFYLRWSQSRTLTPAPTKMSRLRNSGCDTVHSLVPVLSHNRAGFKPGTVT